MTVRVEKSGPVTTVINSRPAARNAVDHATAEALTAAFLEFEADDEALVAVFWGEGGAFCGGWDLKAASELAGRDNPLAELDFGADGAVPRGPMGPSRLQLSKPVIAAVAGPAVAGGFELALWCDLVIASENAVLGQTGAKVGACPTVGATQYIPRIIGERLAREMIFCARRFTAREAVEVGLINKCVPQKDLMAETLKWCETMKGHSALTIRMTKRSLNFESDNLYSSWQHGMELLAHVWGSDEANEGMTAFLEGRKPNFQQFRLKAKRELAGYLDGCERNLNEPPEMRKLHR